MSKKSNKQKDKITDDKMNEERKPLVAWNQDKLPESSVPVPPDLSKMKDLCETNDGLDDLRQGACARPFTHKFFLNSKDPADKHQRLTAWESGSATHSYPDQNRGIFYVENKNPNISFKDAPSRPPNSSGESVNHPTPVSKSKIRNKENIHSGKERNKSHDGGSKHFCNVRMKPMSFTALKELLRKEPNEILLKISHENCPFQLLFAKEETRTDMISLILMALGKVCLADLQQTLCTFLNFVKSKTDFLRISIQTFLVSLHPNSTKDYHLKSLRYLLIFLQKLQQIFPSSASTLLLTVFPLLRKTFEVLNGCAFNDDTMNKLKNIEELNEYFGSHFTKSKIEMSTMMKALSLMQVPENFRSLSILPTIGDIDSDPFLSPNIVEGRYSHVEHYLDVQFRLLREDYVIPLRDGISEYLRLKKQGKSVENCKNAKVYEKVRIVNRKFVNGNMLHIAQFSNEIFSRIKWEYSKYFLTGSLLCLSSDGFKSMLFASVAQRIPNMLKKGLLWIRFEEISDEMLNISPLREFVIIETSAYFESYRHNLKALQELNEKVLPLKEYIIDVKTYVKHPRYLHNFTTYDIRPLLVPMDGTHIKYEIEAWGEISFLYEFPDGFNIGKSVQILNDSNWPCASDLKLDNSQYLALKAALTREFAIIQGPPGTGKTYIGLRTVQLLLHNISQWFREETNSLPILVVCFTNHALDQFLEGMMSFTNKIVRIGGRGSNEAVSQFQLNNRRKVWRKDLPKHIRTAMSIQNQNIRMLKTKIDKFEHLVLKSIKNVLREKDFKNYLPEIHYLSLMSIVDSAEFRELNLIGNYSIIYNWLGISSRFGWDYFQNCSEAKDEVKHQEAHSELAIQDEEDYSIDEADIERIEAQKDLNNEDFAEVFFDIENQEKEKVQLTDNNGQDGKNKRLNYIKSWLNKSKAMEETEASKISNVWDLNLHQRWNLYKYWLEKMIANTQEECSILQAQLKVLYQEMWETKTKEDLHILKKAQVLGMTTTGAAKYRNIVQMMNPQILIVEEAAEILESHIVTSLAPNTQHVILIGDHQQLRPLPTVHKLAVKYDMNISLFERMVKNKMDYFKLLVQHRMRPDIRDLIVPHIYKKLINHKSVTKYENIKGVDKNVFFITHDYSENENDSSGKSNDYEAKFLVKLCNYLIQQGYDTSQITVLSTYSKQHFLIKKMAQSIKNIQNVKFATVDNYQGEENDIILMSFVRSNNVGEIGFLKVSNRVCVALSRARKGLYCIGNFELLAEKSNLWKNIRETLKQKGAIGQFLPLSCQNHPHLSSKVATEKDFESVTEGGCTKMCEYRLTCGHVCPLKCHPYDPRHLNVSCIKKCERKCEEGHECPKKCHFQCDPCEFLVTYKVFPCEHTIKVSCSSKQSSSIICSAKCDKKLNCGHMCPNKCGEICANLCREIVTVDSPICKHIVNAKCCFKTDPKKLVKKCNHPCNKVLECGHQCKGICKQCHRARMHLDCNEPCKRRLVCGHECKSRCAISCPPCELCCHLASLGTAVTNVSDTEIESTLQAMDLSVGHWFQCPYGHVYYITEWGAGIAESRCNECSSNIDGLNHELLTTNRIATTMDGATHSAWPDVMYLQNPVFLPFNW